tara:strand:+ start:368 stop:523 length:156 start_codon:yes stop_codon:yes gene_type:complete
MSKLYNEYIAPKLDKVAQKIPGYKKVKKIIPKGLKLDIGKNKVGISYSKKF